MLTEMHRAASRLVTFAIAISTAIARTLTSLRRVSRKGLVFAAVAALATVAFQARAGGFYVSEIGTPGSLGTAGAANPTNNFTADSAYTNPAGMMGLSKDLTVMSGGQVVLPLVTFDADIATAGGKDGNNVGVVAPIPSFFAVKRLSDRARAGFSIVAPLGGGADYGNGFVGRYSVNKATLSAVALSPSFGYRISDKLSVGAGASLLYTLLEQEISIRQPGGAPDGELSIDKADDFGFQGFLGLTYQATERLMLGLVYRSKANVNLKGDLVIRRPRLPFSPTAGIKVNWDNPQLVELGIKYRLSEATYLVANADWEDWSEFSDNQFAVQAGALARVATIDRNWKDTYHLGLGLIKLVGDTAYSVGVGYDTTPVNDGDRTLDLPADEQFRLSMAIAKRPEGALNYALGATLFYAGEGNVDQTSQGVRVKGNFDKNWLLFLGGTVRWEF